MEDLFSLLIYFINIKGGKILFWNLFNTAHQTCLNKYYFSSGQSNVSCLETSQTSNSLKVNL